MQSTLARGMSREAPRSRAFSRDLLCSILLGLAVFAAYVLIWARWIKPDYYPHGDSFALLVNSLPIFHPDFRAWFTQGFQPYFHVYPDLSRNATNFIRPGVNATFYLEWFLFGSHWERYLLTTYAAIAAIASLVYYTATCIMTIPRKLALLAAIAAAFAPSVDTNALWDPTFAFDLLAGAFVLAGLVGLIRGHLVPAWLFLSFAAFTKETALFAPPLAALILLLYGNDALRRRIARAVLFLLPVLAWGTLRWLDFRDDRGFYVLMQDAPRHSSFHEALVRVLSGGVDWPIATQVFRNEKLPIIHVLRQAGLVLSITFWLGLAAVLIVKLRGGTLRPKVWLQSLSGDRQEAARVIVVLFCIGSLATPMLFDIPRRFGASFFPLFVLCLVLAGSCASLRIIRGATVAMTAFLGVAGALLLSTDLLYLYPPMVHTWKISRAYVEALHASKDLVLFSVDDPSGGWSSDQYVQRFAGYQGRLVRVSDLAWNGTCSGTPDVSLRAESSEGELTITSTVFVNCGAHYFGTLYPPLNSKWQTFTRNLEQAHIQYNRSFPGANSSVDMLTVRLLPKLSRSGVLIPHFDTDQIEHVLLPAPQVGRTYIRSLAAK